MNTSISSSYTLEIVVKSAEALTIGNQKPVTKDVFVTLSTENQGYTTNHLQTRLCDKDPTPTWNEKMLMDVPITAKFILLEVRYKKRSSEKSIGVAKVPTSDFLGNNMLLNYQHCLCYRLRDHYGEPNGIINFSVNVKGNNRLDNYQCDGKNHNYTREVTEIQGFKPFGNREDHYRLKPRIGSSLLRKSSATVVGVPAAWYDSCYAR